MKRFLLFFLILQSIFLSAQKIERFYDWQWKQCDPSISRYYAVIEFQNGLWHRQDYFIRELKLQMDGFYKDSSCRIQQGSFHYFHANGNLEATGKYENGKMEGLWLRYHNNGMMADSAVYKNGVVVGTELRWYANGYPEDSIQNGDDGSTVQVSWFDDGTPAAAGIFQNGKMHGKWKFFHKNGNPSAIEIYENGVLKSKEYYDESGAAVRDTANRDAPATFPGGIKGWVNYLSKNLYFPEQYQITNGDKAIVVLGATIDEDGKVSDVFVSAPFHPAFDDIAVRILKKSPKWKPAISHNRRVKQNILQPISFVQSEGN